VSTVIDNVIEPLTSAGTAPISGGRITIGEVATAAGVSVATVSKVINNRYGVSDQTAARVRAVIEKLGYESSLVAQSLRSRRTNVIGILLWDFEPFSAELLKGAAHAMRGTGYEMVVYSGGGLGRPRHGWERRYASRLSGLTDGAILVTPTVADLPYGSPVVAVDPQLGTTLTPTVDSDNLTGAQQATQFLIGLGHRRIGFLAGRADLESARRRELGYREALAMAGIGFDPDLVRVGNYREEDADPAARELLAHPEPPTAVFAANDIMAMTTSRVALSLGLRVPDDLSVVGFDNIPESALNEPPLTTVEQPIQRMGAEAVEMLVSLIAGRPVDNPHLTLPTKLIVRQSCRILDPVPREK
jgi:LacI family transcriptional regulator